MKKRVISLIINLFIVISTLVIVIMGIKGNATIGQVGYNEMKGWGYFKAFTVDSNTFMAIMATVVAGIDAIILIKKDGKVSKLIETLYLMSTTSVFITLTTVIFFLSPLRYIHTGNFIILYSGTLFFFHLLNPLLAIICFTMFMKDNVFSYKYALLGVIPTFLYAIVYVIMILINKWSDFYNFTFGGKYYLIPLAAIVMFALSFGLAFYCIKQHNKTTD